MVEKTEHLNSPEGLDKSPLERFDQLISNLTDYTDNQEVWRPIPQLGAFIYLPQKGPYTPSVYFEASRTYIRRAYLDESNPQYQTHHAAAEEGLAALEKVLSEEVVSERFNLLLKPFLENYSASRGSRLARMLGLARRYGHG